MALRYTRHSWSSVCVFFFFSHWFRIYLNISEIVFVIVHNENFRETRKSNFWIQCFGNNCPKTWSYIKTGIKGKQFIRMWFRCHAHVRWVRLSIFLWTTRWPYYLQESSEAWNYQETWWISEGQYVRDSFQNLVVILNIQVHFIFWIPFELLSLQ